MKRIIYIAILICIVIGCLFNYTYGASIWEMRENWLSEGNTYKPSNLGNTTGFNDLAGILWGAGIWVILITGTVLGIRFMISEPDKKAELKKALIPFAIGSIIIMAALTIWNLAIIILDI